MARTLWEEGRQPGRQVASLAAAVTLLVVAVDLSLTATMSLFFDLAFVGICVAAALAVRPRDFFVVGVLPPLLMFGTVLLLAVTARDVVAEPVDGPVQAVVSGLAHHARALVIGYGLTLTVVAVRKVSVGEGAAHRRTAGLGRVDVTRPGR